MTTALLLVAVAAGCGSKSDATNDSSGGGGSTAKVFGPKDPATGTPVKVGLISDGKGTDVDMSIDGPAANATVKYLNEYKRGLGGHPIKLQTCLTRLEPAKAADCANQMIESNVAAVLIGASAVYDSVWPPLHAAHIPTVLYAATSAKLLLDRESTFVLSAPAATYDVLADAAKRAKAKKVTAVIIDVPTTLSTKKTMGPVLAKYGVKLDVMPVPPGTPDMSPQMQQVVSNHPGVVYVLGNEAFCISAFNGLRTANFGGKLVTISQCISDATRKAVPGSFFDGVTMSSTVPIGAKDSSTALYDAVAKTFGKNIDTEDPTGLNIFSMVAGFGAATHDIKGAVTPANIIATMRSMPEEELPGSGGQRFRCNGKAVPELPAVCVRSALVTTLDDHGDPTTYRTINNTPIPN